MKRIRTYLIAVALIMSLSGSAFLGVGAGSAASLASSQHAKVPVVVAKSSRSVVFLKRSWCPTPGLLC